MVVTDVVGRRGRMIVVVSAAFVVLVATPSPTYLTEAVTSTSAPVSSDAAVGPLTVTLPAPSTVKSQALGPTTNRYEPCAVAEIVMPLCAWNTRSGR